MHPKTLTGDAVSLLPLRPDDVTDRYVGWLNDPTVMRHTMAGKSAHTIETTQAYVQANIDDSKAILWRIVVDGAHVGNLRLSLLDPETTECDIAIIIGEATRRGRGIGPKAIALATEYAQTECDRETVQAVISAANEASLKAFERAGYITHARKPGYFALDGRPIDGVWMVNRRNGEPQTDG